jgi:5-methylcytosine-specific restriction endonuclease McrA
MCADEGRIKAAAVVDHIKAHRGDETLFWDQRNWQSLCKPCHDRHKKREEMSGRKTPVIGLDGWPVDRR